MVLFCKYYRDNSNIVWFVSLAATKIRQTWQYCCYRGKNIKFAYLDIDNIMQTG